MRIAIHHTPGSFSDRWLNYCKKHNIDYKIVNCYSSDIILLLKNCDALMWHHHHGDYKDVLFAKQLIFAVEQSGKKTFPDYKSCWHFDDKLGQKYLFESIGAPLVPSYVFFTKQEAMQWIDETTFPKVFKLRGGAGSANVKLIKTVHHAQSLVNTAFGEGFSQFDRFGNLKDQINKFRSGKVDFLEVLKGVRRLFIGTEYSRFHRPEKGYVYFQDYLPGNLFDIRVVVIGGKAFGVRRLVRKGDFRASGSGNVLYEKKFIPLETIKLAFQLADKLQSQCAAFDFVYDALGRPFVLELSFGFTATGPDLCVGYWDKSFQFHEGKFIPQDWMVETLL